jgi:formiminotetrahydrofolate cyclodeaminase
MSLDGFTELLASAAATPGGGSAAAVAASLAASLTAMVARLSQDRPRYAEHARTHERVLPAADAWRIRFLQLADKDAAAYAAYAEARRLPADTPEQSASRASAMAAAAVTSAEVPLEVVRACHELIGDVEAMAGRSNLNAASDLEVAAQLTVAAARGAAANVHANLPSVNDQRVSGTMLSEVEARLHEIESAVARVHEQVRSGNLRSPEAAASAGG